MSHTQDINNKVQNIKNAAMRVYGSQGLGASLEDVAADAGVTTEEILAEFSSVEELQSACTNEVFDVIEATHGSLNPTTTCSNTWRPPTSTNRSSATWRCVCAPAATSPVASSSR